MIKVYTKDKCVQCDMTKRWLRNNGVGYEEINIYHSPEALDYCKSRGFLAAPVIVAGDVAFSGFQPSKLRALMEVNYGT